MNKYCYIVIFYKYLKYSPLLSSVLIRRWAHGLRAHSLRFKFILNFIYDVPNLWCPIWAVSRVMQQHNFFEDLIFYLSNTELLLQGTWRLYK